MVKRTKLSAFISLLLAFVMLLTACSDPDSSATVDEQSKEGLFPGIESIESANNYSDALAKWTQYIEYAAPEKAPVLTGNLFEADNVVHVSENLIVSEKTENNTIEIPAAEENADPTEKLVSTTKTTKWFKTDGTLLKSFVSSLPEFPTDASYDMSSNVSYSFDYDAFGFILVTETRLVLKTAEEDEEAPDPTLYTSYETVVNYDYYNADGSVFLENLEQKLSIRYPDNAAAINAGYYLIDSKDKTFLMNGDAEVVKTFELGMEYNIPVYSETSITVGAPGGDYAYFTNGTYNYVLTEQQAIMMPMGDLVAYVVPGLTITVSDSDWNPVISYESNCYAVAGYAVLTGGNVYICEYRQLQSDAQEYDIASGEEKFNIHHVIINVKDKTVSEIERNFVAQKLFNETTKKINSFTSLITLNASSLEDALLNSVNIKGDYILASINKFENGALNSNTVYAILDNELNIVAELPSITPDQLFYPGYLNASTVIITSRAVDNKIVYFAIDTATGQIKLHPEDYNDLIVTDYGYLYNDKLWSKDWTVIQDYDEVTHSDLRVINGKIYYTDLYGNVVRVDVDPYYNYPTQTPMHYYTYEEGSEDGGRINSNNDLIFRHSVNGGYYTQVCNINGETILEYADEYIYIYSDKLAMNIQHHRTFVIQSIIETETGYIATVLVSQERLTSDFETSGLPDFESHYEYYIIK